MALTSPLARMASRAGVHRLQGTWLAGVAAPRAGVARPASSLSAIVAFGGGGGSSNGKGGNNGNSNGGNGGHGGASPGGSGSSGWGRAAALALAGGVLLCGEGAAFAAKAPAPAPPPPAPKPETPEETTIDKTSNLLWSLVGPVLTNLGFSGCVGAAAGYALKKLGQTVAVFVGLAFLFVQGLAYTGFITVNWGRVHETVHEALDVNKDGKVDEQDFKIATNNVLAALSQGVPSVGGFLGGFLYAVRSF